QSSTYRLDLPDELKNRRIHDNFHVSMLRPYHESDTMLFPDRTKPEPYDFGAPPEAEEFVLSIENHKWSKKSPLFEVHWALGDITWENYSTVNNLKALDEYFTLHGVSKWQDLP
ncbi:hypothetical protein GYMLUDRAFT_127161, partial [Collybiopsis luxurians FD-317 M1]